ncbi:AraC family transcriptional regulator [Paenibacillus sp. SYP-B3998]|uniref:AraC family transcriptional regulator n=1 Tax=Paenibacillus sp. SYP-B3998 TaxID=2678564 RepID=A0A6G4A445_9BACL|nr:AraC family transcriptional regulator [Paenibacillus sp. SYP-B3998]NEW09100.1 AraC family transcriptional regulator [Paenibacillus sp. SYP-B3998]
MQKNDLDPSKKMDFFEDEDFEFIIADTEGIDKDSTELHWHDWMEVNYIKRGTGNYIIGDREYAFEEGDIFIINARDLHFAFNDHNLVMQVMLFEPKFILTNAVYAFEILSLLPFWKAGILFENKLEKNNEHHKLIVSLLQEMQNEYERKQNGFKLIIKSLILKLAVIFERYLESEGGLFLSDRIMKLTRFRPVFEHIKRNSHLQIKLSELASLVNMSVSNFSLVFKKSMGVSPIEYVNRERAIKASQLLIETDMKIADIAEFCGFSCTSYFIKEFKKFTGEVPSHFRKSVKGK